MKSLDFGRCALTGCVAAAMLAGCGALRQAQDDMQPPIGAPGEVRQTSAFATHADRGTSWMLPEAAHDDLLYTANANADTVSVYSYSEIMLGLAQWTSRTAS
jgi:hypothetical protein